MWFYPRQMCLEGAEEIANSVDPDQATPEGAVCPKT